MGHERRDIDEVARSGLGDKLQGVAPAHAGPALQHIDDAFQGAVMMGAGLGVGVDGHRAGPQLFRAHAGEIDGGGTVHAGGLGCVGVQLVAGNDADA